jgi:protein ImuB
MRYLSLYLPFLPTDRIGRAMRPNLAPAASAANRRGEAARVPRVTIAKVKGAQRLAALDAEAVRLGLRPHMPLADARAMYPQLDVHEADPAGDLTTRDAIADWCRRFTPFAAADGPEGVLLDISGVAALFGGEEALRADLTARLAAQGFASETAIAPNPAAAWALARYGGRLRLIEEAASPETLARLFAPFPLAALRLEASVIGRLAQAGLKRVGDLLLRPRAPLAARFGRDLHHRLDLLLGQAKAPISPRFEAPAFVAERRFAEGLGRREDIEATIEALARDLCGLLARHGEGARRLDLTLYRVDGVVKHLTLGTGRPLRDPLALTRLFRERIEALGEDGLETGYGFDVIRLAALAAERLEASEEGWLAEGGEAADVADLIDRLGARFGLGRVSRLACGDSHQPERATRSLPATAAPQERAAARKMEAGVPNAGMTGTPREALPTRPLRLIEPPDPITTIAAVPDGPPLQFKWRRVTHQVAAIEGPERIGPDWWRPQKGVTRDYFRAEDTDGRRFWLFREGLYYETAEPRWFLHGLFG